MDHPLASSVAGSGDSARDGVEHDGERIATPTDGDVMGSGPCAERHMPDRPPYGFQASSEMAPEQDYQTRLSRLLDDDDDIGQEREAGHEWANYDRELSDMPVPLNVEDVGYFDESGIHDPSSWARDDYHSIPVTPRQESLPRAPATLGSPAETWNRKALDVESPARSAYRRPSYLHPSISRLRAHDRKVSTSTTGTNANPFGLSPSKLGHDWAPSTASRRSAISRKSSLMGPLVSNDNFERAVDTEGDSERPPSMYEGNSVTSGIPIQAEEYRNRTAFTFQTMRTASDVLWPPTKDGHRMPPVPQSGIFGASGTPPKKKRFSLASAVSGRNMEESVVSQLEEQDKGKPVVLDVKGVIAVGTDTGWIIVFDFEQQVKCICGMASIAQESGPVTALTVSPDGTFVAVGHLKGNVYLYDLANPGRPARSALALPLAALMSGRKEGHLIGTKIVDIDFVGKRHTAIVTSDETGRAFWWSLGKVMGVESNDVVRLLGGLPDAPAEKVSASGSGASTPDINPNGTIGGTAKPRSKGSTIYAGKVLPVGKVEHQSDTYHLTAFLTPSKLVIVGLKPTPRIWFKRSRGLEGGERARHVGCTAWLPAGFSSQREEAAYSDGSENVAESPDSDPIIAFSWGNSLRLVRVRSTTNSDREARTLAFDDVLHWREDQPILALDWLNPEHLLIATSIHLSLLDVRNGQRVEHSQYSMLSRLSWNPDSRRERGVSGRLRTHRGKIFMLAETDLRAGSVLLWADRILALCHAGDFLSAIHLAVAYYSGTAGGNTIGLSADISARKSVLKARALSLMRSSLAYAFSQDRLTDGTYDSPDGRGVDLTPLFEDLADTCLNSCLLLDETSFAYEEVYEAYLQAGIQGIYLAKLEKTLLETRLRDIPPNLIQGLIQRHDNAGEYKKAEDVIWHVEPMSLDINQAITLCERNNLWDAYAYVFNQCMMDYLTPIAKFISLMRPSNAQRDLVSAEHLPQAYTLFRYLETTLIGCEFPDGRRLPEGQANRAREAIYTCLLSRGNIFLKQSQVMVDLEAGDFPVLRTILHYDTEALLHVLDIGFEDGYLNDSDAFTTPSRQEIVDALIKVMTPVEYPVGDITFMHIFLARNLPKYPQFIRLSSDITRQILISLARDPDIATREDRQLAAEHLLSVYLPPQVDERRIEFQHAQFYRILRADYAKTREWHEVIRCIVEDPDLEKEEVFEALREALTRSKSTSVAIGLPGRLPQMLAISVPLTARLLDDFAPTLHREASASLQSSPVKQCAYLGALLQPEMLDMDEEGSQLRPRASVSTRLAQSDIQDYVRLLCQLEPRQLLPWMQTYRSLLDMKMTTATCEDQEAKSAVVWAMDTAGDAAGAIRKLNEYLTEEAAPFCADQEDVALLGTDHRLKSIRELVSAGIQVCTRAERVNQERSSTETLWFDLLARLVRVAQSALRSSGEESSAVRPEMIEREHQGLLLVGTLRQCIQDTLAALISSSTSSTISFPRLFRRLVQASGTEDDAESASVYSEFRLILVSMLSTYHGEEDMLVLATKLVQGEVFGWMKELTANRTAGWRVDSTKCTVCSVRFRLTERDDKKAEDEAASICIPRTGLPYHWACVR